MSEQDDKISEEETGLESPEVASDNKSDSGKSLIRSEQAGTEKPSDETYYPIRKPSEDPGWAVKVVWTWVGIAVFLLLFIITLFILGFWFD